jgi:hypothetical protein
MATIQESRQQVTAEDVRCAWDYDAVTGEFRWKVRTSKCVRVGDVAGASTSNGYTRLRLNGVEYLAHRIAWLYVYGEHPSNLIDHIDGNKKNNAISNLRVVTFSENIQNQKRAMPHNTCGLLGVTFEKQTKKYKASINIGGGNSKTLGRFNTAEEAHQVYLNAKRVHHAGCTL